jgi:PAS domain-containing protein
MERQALAMTGSGDIVWDWDVLRDRSFTSPDVRVPARPAPAALEGPPANGCRCCIPTTATRFRTALDVVLEHRRGRVVQDFRLRGADGHYHWFALKARPVVGSDGEVIRCVGTMVDVTEFRRNPKSGCCTTPCTTT